MSQEFQAIKGNDAVTISLEKIILCGTPEWKLIAVCRTEFALQLCDTIVTGTQT
jgi:hypothetical protein